MFSLSHDFKTDLLWIFLAEIWKKQCFRFTNPELLLLLKRENRSAELPTTCDLCRCRWIRKELTVVCSKTRALVSWNYLNLLKVSNFKQLLRLLKRKTNWHVAGSVGYCPTLLLSAIRLLRPPHAQSESFLPKTNWRLQYDSQCIWQLKSSSFEHSILNSDRYNNSCTVKDVLLTRENFYFLRT